MRKGRVFFLIALILILGLVAVGFVYMRMLSPASQPAEPTPTQVVDKVGVVFVAQRVPRGSRLDETVLTMVQIPRELLIPGYFTDMGQVVGRQAKVDLEANMPLTDSMVVSAADQLSTSGSLAALSIPKGMVAVSIPINRLSSVSYAPQAGDHVNVIAAVLLVDLDTDYQSITPNYNAAVLGAGPGLVTGSGSGATDGGEGQQGNVTVDKETNKITGQTVSAGPSSVIGKTEIDPLLEQTFYAVPSERQRPRLVSQTLLQDAIVLGIGDFPLKEEQEAAASQPTAVPEGETPTETVPEEATDETGAPVATPEPKLPDVITLIVTPQDAVTLNYLIYSGAQLTLVLRPSGDDTRVQTEATTLDFLLKNYNLPVPVKLPYGMEPRVDELIPPQLPNDIVPTPQP